MRIDTNMPDGTGFVNVTLTSKEVSILLRLVMEHNTSARRPAQSMITLQDQLNKAYNKNLWN